MKPSPVSVTAIIPAHNAAALLPRCLDSVLAQTAPIEEVIVIDDGSADNTAEVVAGYGAPVRCVRQENRGVAGARNHGIRLAGAEWVAFLDADDRWVPEKIERQLALAALHPEAAVVYSDALIVQPDGRVSGRFLTDKHPASGWIFDDLLNSVFVLPSTVIARREALVSVGMFAEHLRRVEDYHLWLRLAPLAQFAFVPEPLTLYGRQETSLSKDIAAMARSEISVLQPLLGRNLTEPQRRSVRRRLARRLFDLAYETRRLNPRESTTAAWTCLRMEPDHPRNWQLFLTSVLLALLPSAGQEISVKA